jgi:hypothetical protein
MAVMIDSWPLPQMPLRFLRISRGTYQTIIGEAPQQTRYTIARQPRRWRVERSLQQPGGDWAIVSVQPAESLKGAIEWCDVDVRENGALRSPAAAGRLAERADVVRQDKRADDPRFQPRQRRCLRCLGLFPSQHAGHRICDRCRSAGA